MCTKSFIRNSLVDKRNVIMFSTINEVKNYQFQQDHHCLCEVGYTVSASDPTLMCTESTSNSDDDDFGNLVEGEQISLTCLTTFYGLWGPTQDWTDNSGNILPASDVSAGNIIEYTHTVCTSLTTFTQYVFF